MNGELQTDFIVLVIKAIVLWGLAGVLAFEVMKLLNPRLKTAGWTDFALRWLALVLAGLIALAGWALGIALGIFQQPGPTWQAWFIDVAAVVGMATGASQWIHGLVDKRG